MRSPALLALALLTLTPVLAQQTPATEQAAESEVTPGQEAVKKAMDSLRKSQREDGHWDGTYSVAITSMAGLAFLATTTDHGISPEAWKATRWLLSQAKEGNFPKQGHTWIHGQGFATLFLAEVYGRTLLTKGKPKGVSEPGPVDTKQLKETVQGCVRAIQTTQSAVGGWWYHPSNNEHHHEGSTTVCAIQALRAAANYGLEIDKGVLSRGFAYLKKSQNPNGSFQYRLGDGSQMRAGTAGGIATLALMHKVDYPVLVKGVGYLASVGPKAVTGSGFPFYGHFYSVLGMKLVHDEMGDGVPATKEWHKPVEAWLLESQDEQGRWQHNGHAREHAYATSLGVLILSVRDERISIFKRDPPELPKKSG